MNSARTRFPCNNGVPDVAGGIARGLALFFAALTLAGLLMRLAHPGWDANVWWVDLRRVSAPIGTLLMALLSGVLATFAWRPTMGSWRRLFTLGLVGFFLVVTLFNTLVFWSLLWQGTIGGSFPVPGSAWFHLALWSIWSAARRESQPVSDCYPGIPLLTLLACFVVFPVLLVFCFGLTDYRRPADVAVVFGARTYANGRPSDALADRVRTACDLYRAGTVSKLFFSGGPGDGTIHETEAMRRMALGLGVAPKDILIDTEGRNTDATIHNLQRVVQEQGFHRVLAVSHFYHLPRIKLSAQRAGLEVYTVPAHETVPLRQLPYSIVREIPAFWMYYGRGLASARTSPPTA